MAAVACGSEACQNVASQTRGEFRLKCARAIGFAVALSASIWAAQPAAADDAVGPYQIQSVVERADFVSQANGVQFFFGDAPTPGIRRRIESNVTTSLRTRKFGRSNEEACQWVMMSALMQLRDRATAVGGNAVVNIRSNWQNVETSSRTEYQCAAGFLMAGVALKGDIVALR